MEAITRQWIETTIKRGAAFLLLTIASMHVVACETALAAIDAVRERARAIPMAYDVDVVVVGGATRGVSAALAAREAGARVFLMAERPYLGVDVTAHYRLWLEPGETPTTPLAHAIYPGTVQTPMEVKRILDEALLDAGVEFLYGCYATDVLRDRDGELTGIVMANKAGRQALRAKVIIDATDRATVARIAGAAFSSYPAGAQLFRRRVIGGEPERGDATLIRKGLVVPSDARRGRRPPTTNDVYAYALRINMEDGSWPAFAKAEQVARDRTWQDGQVDASEWICQVPPDSLISSSDESGEWHTVDDIDLHALMPRGMNGLYVLGGCADVSREIAKQLTRPVYGMVLGKAVGLAAAMDAKYRSIAAMGDMMVSGRDGGVDVGEIGEMLNGLRSQSGLGVSQYVESPERSIPVLGNYDVVVVGGGTAGAPAAISAARAGAKTLVLEYLDGLGGVGTLGRINSYYHGNPVGFTMEIDAGAGGSGWNIEKKMEWFRREIRAAGGDIWFRSLGCGSVVRDHRFVGVVVATPHGRGVVLANTVIDATGNAVIPACAGVPCQEIGSAHIAVQGAGLPTFSPGVGYLNGDWTFIDDSDVMDMWRAFIVAKQKFRDKYRGYDLGQLQTTRARRRIIGDIIITPMDVINERTYPDTITVSKSNFDNHGFSSHDLFMIISPRSRVCHLPYRALMPKGYDGILVTGLGISAHGDAMPVLRMQRDVQNHGYAAGHAAAMASKTGKTIRRIDVKVLQRHLVEKGIIPEEMLLMKDSYPYSDVNMQEAVARFETDYSGVPVILTDPARSIPLLQAAWKEMRDPDARLRIAHVLGILGDDTGVDTLIARLRDAEWDEGWNFRGMGQYGPTTSPIDNLVIALGRTRSKRALPVVLRLLDMLTPESAFSHQRAVAIACEMLADTRAAKPLYKLLSQEGMRGHAFTTVSKAIAQTPPRPGDTSTRRRSLPELILARALYRCGDHNGLGKRILKMYAQDLRGHYASHAKAVLLEMPEPPQK